MNFSYVLEDEGVLAGWEHSHELSTAGREELLWNFFPGDISICTEDAILETNFGWVPILHFCLSLVGVVRDLLVEENAVARYVFTEADESLTFHRKSNLVTMQSSFSSTLLVCAVVDLRNATMEFAPRVISELGASYPSLLKASIVEEISSMLKRL